MHISDSNVALAFRNWCANEFVFLQAPTGVGKTYFVKNDLLPYAMYYRKGVLIFVNRISLKQQLDFEIQKFIMENFPWMQGYPILVMTYQQLEEMVLRNCVHNFFSQFFYVVCDEAHFFLSDANFNPMTILAYKEIIRASYGRVTIFISATLENIEFYTRNNYYKIWCEINNVTACADFMRFVSYSFGYDYGKYRFTYAETMEDLVNYVARSNEKFLLFVSSISEGVKIQKELFDKAGMKFPLIDAAVKEAVESEEYKIWEELIVTHRFEVRVLITTAFLDNGISIHDDDLHNVVVLPSSREQFIQMCGRKRVKEGESVNIIMLKRKAAYYSTKLKGDLYPALKLCREFYKDNTRYNMERVWEDVNIYHHAHKFCYYDPYKKDSLKISPLSVQQLEIQKNDLETLYQIAYAKGGEYALQHQMQEWLQIPNSEECLGKLHVSKEIEKMQLKEQLDFLVNRPMTIQEFHRFINPLRELMKRIAPLPKSLRPSDNISADTLRSFFEDTVLPYTIEKVYGNDRKVRYVIRKIVK